MRLVILAVAATLVPFTSAQGAEANGSRFESVYTDLDFDQCTTLESDDMGATLVCPGYKGYPVVVSEGDLRMFVSYGIRPMEEKAIEQTLPPFNHLGGKVEWRIERDDDFWQPRATIVRWFTAGEDGTDKGQILVVTQLKTGATCHIAYVDAVAVKDANQAAREIADKEAGSFDCSKEPVVVQPFRAY